MFDALKEFFQGSCPLKYDKNGIVTSEHIRFAVTALLWQVIQADDNVLCMETDRLFHLIAQEFDLSKEDSNELMSVVQSKESLYQTQEFLQVVRENFTEEQRKHIVEMASNIAFADESLENPEALTVDLLAHHLGLS
ncbi:MAG: TerB family tellurite resistance protein [Bdellovibrionales bacterium]|nr:TerB family tellurite resistance protein [Bdellovibrionales bacterium]